MNYYLFDNQEVKGPFSLTTIGEMLDAGDIPDGALATAEGSEDWIPVTQLASPENGSVVTGESPQSRQREQSTSGALGMSFTCMSTVAPTSHRRRKLAVMASIGCTASLLIIGSLILWTMGVGKKNPTRSTAEGNRIKIFSSKNSNKCEILGLRGGMSVEEATATLKLDALKPATSDEYADTPWEPTLPGFSAYEFEPGGSFPIKHLSKIRLVFLEGRLQSLCYVYVEMPLEITLHKNLKTELCTDKRSALYNFTDNYDRQKLCSDVRALLAGSFEFIDDELYPDYTSGRLIPKGGEFDVRPARDGGQMFPYSASPIFNAASSEIFVRFYSSIKNKREILQDLAYQIMTPELVSAFGMTSEIFFLQFSFRNTYEESLSVARAHEAKESAIFATKVAETRKKQAEAQVEERRKEEDRIKNLRKGL